MYLIRNSGSYQKLTCRFKYPKHFNSESFPSREKCWLEPDKSCSYDSFKVVFYYVVSPRITIEDLETKGAAALLPQANAEISLIPAQHPWEIPDCSSLVFSALSHYRF